MGEHFEHVLEWQGDTLTGSLAIHAGRSYRIVAMDQVDCHQCLSREMNTVGFARENEEGKQQAREDERKSRRYTGVKMK